VYYYHNCEIHFNIFFLFYKYGAVTLSTHVHIFFFLRQVSLCANVAVARSELGELFLWGGTSTWWHQVSTLK
jgi:hypothetical protein